MRVLALDTSERAGSAALVEDGRILDERPGDGSRKHGARLPGELEALGARWSSIDVFAVAAGPGSFTGLRIGIATMQGLALVSGRPVVGVSALEAHAQLVSRGLAPGALVASWIDAQRGDVFSALYRVADAAVFTPERLVEVEPPAVASPILTLDAWTSHDTASATFVGDGAVRYEQAIHPGGSRRRIVAPVLIAGAIGCMAAVSADWGLATGPALVHPLYVRRPDVELHRTR